MLSKETISKMFSNWEESTFVPDVLLFFEVPLYIREFPATFICLDICATTT